MKIALSLVLYVCASFTAGSAINMRSTIGQKCVTPYADGTCQTTKTCTDEIDLSVPGYCPGPKDEQCCVDIQCFTPEGDGWCTNTAGGCPYGGHYVSGYCPGPDSFKCCVGA